VARKLINKFMDTVTIDGEEFALSPLPVGKIKLLSSAFDPEKVSEMEMFENMIYFIHASLSRITKEITIEFIEDNITIIEASEIFKKVIEVSGAVPNNEKKTQMK
jgi:hypothetical protein